MEQCTSSIAQDSFKISLTGYLDGESGLDGTDLLPKPLVSPKTGSAVDAIATALRATPPNTAWLIATGALTNIALLFASNPDLTTHIAGLSIMGGSIGNSFTSAPMGRVDDKTRIGNWSQWAEFNILVDPEAAAQLCGHEVLRGKMVLIPLDVTHLCLATTDVQGLLEFGTGGERKGECSTMRRMFIELLNFFAHTYRDVFGIVDGPPLHDPLAVAVILDGIAGVEIPFYDRVEGGKRERYAVKVITEGTHEDALAGAQTGRTIATLLEDGEEGIKIPRGLDVKRFWTVLEECMGRADEVNRTNDGL